MKKLTLLLAGAAGYVLGTRAGRERYEQIKQAATRTWRSEPVQGAVDTAREQAGQAAGDVSQKVASTAADAATAARAKVAEAVGRRTDADAETEAGTPPTLVGRGTA